MSDKAFVLFILAGDSAAVFHRFRSENIFWAIFAFLMVLGFGSDLSAAQLQPQTASPSTLPAPVLLNQFCLTCHSGDDPASGLALDGVNVHSIASDLPVWEAVVKKLRTGSMPPPGLPRPAESDTEAFAEFLETELDRAAASSPDPGRPPYRRLNRTEYSNVVRDLLGIDTEAIDIKELLPPDESAHGFDNIGAALAVSPLLMERYLFAARRVARIAVGDPETPPVFETYTSPRFLMQDEHRMSEDLPFGSRGGTAIRHHFPADGEYIIQIRLQRMARESIRGLLDASHEIEVRMDGRRIQVFKVGGENRGPFEYFGAGRSGDPAQEEYERTADDHLQFRVHLTAGTHVVGVTFPKKSALPEGPLLAPLTQIEFAQFKGGVPAVGSVIIGGPYEAKGIGDTPSRSKIFICRPTETRDEEACARKILSTLARSGYRRPVAEEDAEILLAFYAEGRREGDFDAGIRAALERLLLDPEFLFRIERDPPNVGSSAAYQISDLELAARLSFFLWSSIPDAELLRVAEDGRLNDPAVLEQQVLRMLGDSRSESLISNFAGQWLLLRNLPSMNPDPEVFSYFDENLRQSFQRETELLVQSLVREDRSLLRLLDADYTFVNERLAEHYGIPNVYGNRFRRVALEDPHRRGLLGHGSVLLATSYANRTAPTLRGKWILDNILGAPPPPPPPNIPDLKEADLGGRILSVRERMEAHRANPACAGCHSLMDPLGFALENFDGIGGWRTVDGDSQIDASGVLPDGDTLRGPAELREFLLARSDQFVTSVTERLLTYALGRGLEYYDAPTVRRIIRESAPSDYRWSSIVLSIVKSAPFQMRRSQS